MIRMGAWPVSVIVVLWFLGIPGAQACSCLQSPAPDEELKRSDAVFQGTVVGFETQGEPEAVKLDESQLGKFYRSGRRATFRVWTVWKGPRQQELVVLTGEGGGDCGFDFIIGHEYLVYADKGPSGTYHVGICGRTRDVWASARRDAKEDFQVLGEETVVAK